MSGQRLELNIDVFDKPMQKAMAMPDLTPTELVEAILQEFQELEYLSDSPGDYVLVHADSKDPLQDDVEIQRQVRHQGRLAILEKAPETPAGAQPASKGLYLRDIATGNVTKVPFTPAIIGRPDNNQPNNELVVVNLESYPTGLRVSRRHAQITEERGKFFIESLSRNPTALRDEEGNMMPVMAKKRPINNGDTIVLERSNIVMKFIVR
jgi:pSer/pThr/pTyr-binding forkhead associated (FHA) protein